ncbi:MAG TPA: metallophosphoesterase [Flavisolibacter sp.]
MYDLIGDIHGHAAALEALLSKLHYSQVDGVWKHPSRKVVFVGDYIDRGPEIRKVLQIVKGMSDSGNAIALMGNHEYNALAYAFETSDGKFLRSHNTKHNIQHQATLDQFSEYENEWEEYLEWFYSLRLFLDTGELRAIHACWDDAHIEKLKRDGIEKMTADLLVKSHDRYNTEYRVINDLLKGKEFNIPEQYAWHDKDGNLRSQNRIKWWKDPANASYQEFLFDCPDELKERMIEGHIDALIYPADAPPVFFGHYWLKDNYPVIQADNVVCLDYSIAKGGNLVAYRWDGESTLDGSHFVSVAYFE